MGTQYGCIQCLAKIYIYITHIWLLIVDIRGDHTDVKVNVRGVYASCKFLSLYKQLVLLPLNELTFYEHEIVGW